jgi:hypothetical protein
VLAGPQGAVQSELLGIQAQLEEAFCLDPPGVPVDDVAQGVAPPQAEGLVQRVAGPVGLPEGEQFAGPIHQSFEPAGVHLVATQTQAIAVGQGLDRIVPEQTAQPHDTSLEVLVPRRRRVVTPDGVREPVRAEHLATGRGECLQDRPVPAVDRGFRAIDRQRPENPNAHEPECPRDGIPRSTPEIPGRYRSSSRAIPARVRRES